MPNILKYFYEEPFLLEALVEDTHPDARRRYTRTQGTTVYRAYLAGSSETGVGLTALHPSTLYTRPLASLFDACTPFAIHEEGTCRALDAEKLTAVLEGTLSCQTLIGYPEPPPTELLAPLTRHNRRYALKALGRLLEVPDALVAWPEPAHQGIDWSLYSATPMRERLVTAFQQYRHPHTRYFVLPYQKARSEEKFYFEHWMLDRQPLPAYIEEL